MPGMLQPQRTLVWSEDGRLISCAAKSLLTGNVNHMDCQSRDQRAITRAQWDAWQAGQNIAAAMPQLTLEEREFLISGATPEEWEAEFCGEDD